MGFHGRHFFGGGRKGSRNQQRLGLHLVLRQLGFQALINNALMGCVHIHHHQTLGVLGQDVHALQLRQSLA